MTESKEERELGPPPPSGGDWSLTPRMGRRLDAANMRLGPPAERSHKIRESSVVAFCGVAVIGATVALASVGIDIAEDIGQIIK